MNEEKGTNRGNGMNDRNGITNGDGIGEESGITNGNGMNDGNEAAHGKGMNTGNGTNKRLKISRKKDNKPFLHEEPAKSYLASFCN